MSYLNEFLTFEQRSEHDLEHDLSKRPQFSTPKIYTANGNLSKRWYVYFSFQVHKGIKIIPGASTLIMCPGESLGESFTNKLKGALGFDFMEDKMVIVSNTDKETFLLIFESFDK